MNQLFEQYQTKEVLLNDEPTTRPWGMREFGVTDINGCSLRFGQSDMKWGDPVAVERVDLNARIEKRLAT